MRQTLELPDTLPGLNEMIAACKKSHYTWNEMKKWNSFMICTCIKEQELKPMKNAYFTFYWYEKTKKRNKDNICAGGRKIILDSLVEMGILKNDGWDEINGFNDHFLIDKKDPHVVVVMIEGATIGE